MKHPTVPDLFLVQIVMRCQAVSSTRDHELARWLILEAHALLSMFIQGLDATGRHPKLIHTVKTEIIDAGPPFARLSRQSAPSIDRLQDVHRAAMSLANCFCDSSHSLRAGSRFDRSLLELAANADRHTVDAYMSAPRSFIASILADKNLHRGVPTSVLLCGIGHIFVDGANESKRASGNVSAWYKLSLVLPRLVPLAGFVSHSWVVGGERHWFSHYIYKITWRALQAQPSYGHLLWSSLSRRTSNRCLITPALPLRVGPLRLPPLSTF